MANNYCPSLATRRLHKDGCSHRAKKGRNLIRRYPGATPTPNKNSLPEGKPLIFLVAGTRTRAHLREVRVA
jgi:hypothetical protein